MKIDQLLTIALLTVNCLVANAQQSFEISSQLVTRPEYRNGYQTLPPKGSDAAFFISQRTRLLAAYSGNKVKFGINMQDVRIWGEEPQVADIASFGLHEGWAEIGFGKNTSLKVGRQEVVYDDHRLFGNLDWVQQGRSHDAAILKITNPGSSLHIGAAYNQTTATLFGKNDPNGYYKALGWLWYNRKFSNEKGALSFYAVTDGFAADTSLHKVKTLFRGTVGPMLNYKSGKVNANLTLFGQFGKDALDRKITAFLAAANIGYALSDKLNVSLGYEYISGNDPSTPADENHKFNTLYATNHKFYGYIDYFLDLPKDTKGGGLQDAFLKLNYKVSANTTLFVDAHYFLLANEVPAAQGNLLDAPLGTELDFTLGHKISESAKLQCGFSVMSGKDSLKALGKVPNSSYGSSGTWGYLMLIVNPTLFKSEKQ